MKNSTGDIQFRIIIVAYRNGPELQAALEALAVQTHRCFEVRIVDNQCPDHCTDGLALPDFRFDLLHAPSNFGFSGGCNLGAKNAQTPWLIMLNPDTRPRPNWLEEVANGINRHPAIGMFGSTQISSHDETLSDGFGDVWSIFGYCWRGGRHQRMSSLPLEDRAVLSPCAAASVYKRSLFERVGGFDTAYFCYLEDVDIGLRLQAIGSGCVQLRSALVIHIGGASDKPTDYAILQTLKNTPRLIRKNAPGFLYPVMLSLFVGSQFWFRIRPGTINDQETRLRWTTLRIGLARRQMDRTARRMTPRLNIGALTKHLNFNPAALRQKPVQSRPLVGFAPLGFEETATPY
jgi:GT2 family glycosyltransferase